VDCPTEPDEEQRVNRRPPIVNALPTTYYINGEMQSYQEETMVPLRKGDGVFLGDDSPCCRVVDVWLSYDHHGHFGEGLHVFLEPVESFSEDDTLGNAAPAYFRED
jgi:hypothetical protein